MNYQNPTKKDVNGKYRGCLIKQMEGDSDSEVPQYSLPPKSIVKRPRKSNKKLRSRSSWQKYCRKFCRHCSSVVLLLVITACVLSIILLFWFALRLYRDMENLSRRLTIEINRVKAEQAENIEKCNSLQNTVQKHIQKSDDWYKNVVLFQKHLDLSFSKIGLMNHTVAKMALQLNNANSKVILKSKVDDLQKGMADTGAEMTKLSDHVKQMEKETFVQLSAIKKIISGLRNITKEVINQTERKERLDDSVDHILDAFNNAEKHTDTTEVKNFKKSFVFTGQSSPNVLEIINKVNQSLYSKIFMLESQTQELKSKFNSPQFIGVAPGNLSRSVYAVRKDLSFLRQLLENLSSRVHNLTLSYQIHLSSQISMNTNDIKMLWDEMEIQNSTLLNIQEKIDKDTYYRPGMQSLPRQKKRTKVYEDIQMFPDQRRFVEHGKRQERNKYKTRSRQSKIWQKTVGSR